MFFIQVIIRKTYFCPTVFLIKFVPYPVGKIIHQSQDRFFFRKKTITYAVIAFAFLILFPYPTRTDVRACFLKLPKKDFIHIGFYPVIRINKADILSFCFSESQIAGGGQALVFCMKYPDSFVLLGILLTNVTTFIGRTIINQQYFKIPICLVEDTIQALVKITFYLIDGNNNTYHLRYSQKV